MRSSPQRPAFTTDRMEYVPCITSIATACRRGGPRESDHQDASFGLCLAGTAGYGARRVPVLYSTSILSLVFCLDS
jgi:hypothetical protein